MEHQVSPSRTITIGDKSFVLDGSFGTLRAVQEAFDRDIFRLLLSIMDMRFDQVAKLVAIASGDSADSVGQHIADTIGVMTSEYGVLKTQIFAWLNVALAPKADREKKSAEMETLVEKQKSFSLGMTTNASPTDSSDGSPANSGEATSGN
jgi:hypothetical protein